MNTLDTTEIVRPLVGLSRIEQDAIGESTEKYVNESMIVTTKNTTTPMTQYKIMNEKQPILSKVKVEEKAKASNKEKAKEERKK